MLEDQKVNKVKDKEQKIKQLQDEYNQKLMEPYNRPMTLEAKKRERAQNIRQYVMKDMRSRSDPLQEYRTAISSLSPPVRLTSREPKSPNKGVFPDVSGSKSLGTSMASRFGSQRG